MTQTIPYQPAPFQAPDRKASLMGALHDIVKKSGDRKPVLDDPDRRGMTYRDFLIGAYTLGAALAKMTARNENVGHLLPTSIGGSVALWSLIAFGRRPAMLNSRAEGGDLLACAVIANLRVVITSHRFVRLAGLEKKV